MESKRAADVSRREFIKGFAAFAAAMSGYEAFAKFDLPPAVPAYYDAYLAERIATINRRRMEGCAAGFFFVTDLHILSNRKLSGLLLARLVKETGLRRVICGGDLPVAFGTPAELDEIATDLWPRCWKKPLDEAGAQLFQVKGNHDFHITENAKRKEHVGLQYSAEETAKIIMSASGNAAAVTERENPAACYCYADDADEKVRYVFADTSDAPCARQALCGVKGGHVQMSDRQLKWLAGKALGTVPAGYVVIVVQHVPLAPAVATAGIPPSLKVFRDLLEAYQAKKSAVLAGETFDFASRVGGDIVVNLTGHHHSDRQSNFGGILHLSESCDAGYNDYWRRTPFSGMLPRKAAKTVHEQTFDCVQVDVRRGLLQVTRIGGGQDRAYHLKPIRVKAGGTATLACTVLKEATDWKAFDCDRAKADSKAQTPETYWTFFNDHGTVSTAGVFTAAKPGPAMAVALDQSLNKEFFRLEVV